MHYTADMYRGPKEIVHLHNHTVYSTLDGVATPDQYAEECKNRGYPAMSATEHGNMASVPDMYLAFKKFGVKYIPGCFLPDQPVLMEQGVREISKVRPGMMAISSLNRPRSVVNLQERHYDAEVLRLKAWGVEDIVCTPEHPFLVREVNRWSEAANRYYQRVTTGMRQAGELYRHKYPQGNERKGGRSSGIQKQNYQFYLCVPRLKSGKMTHLNTTDMVFPDTQEEVYPVIRNATTKRVGLPECLQLNRDLLWIMGLWLAVGSGDVTLIFSLGSDEYHFYQRIADYFAGFGITTSVRDRSDRALAVEVYSSHFARLFHQLFGRGFNDKIITWSMLEGMTTDGARWLLEGLFDGDAKRGDRQSYLRLKNRSLVWQARLLLTKFGRYSAITSMWCDDSSNLSYSLCRRERGRYYDVDDDHIYLPVYDVTRERYQGKVYNFEVEEDHTYNVGVAVHNCEIYYNDDHKLACVARDNKSISPQKANASEDPRVWEDYLRFWRSRHVTVLAKNDVGFRNLIRLTTEANRKGQWRANRPGRLDFNELCKYKEGLIILSGCLNGPIAHELRKRKAKAVPTDRVSGTGKALFKVKEQGDLVKLSLRVQAAIDEFRRWKKAFGEDFFMELQMPIIEDKDVLHHPESRFKYDMVDLEVFNTLIQFADAAKVPMVLANDCHYLRREDHQLQRLMMAIEQGLPVHSPDLFASTSSEQFMKTRGDLWATWKNYPYSEGKDDGLFERMCDNSLLVAERCTNLKMDTQPKIPEWNDADNALRQKTYQALKIAKLDKEMRRWLVDGRMVTYTEQVEIELERFISKGFSSYFLITADLVGYGKSLGYPFGPRGSAGGSLVCMLLGIHSLDPLKWKLSFDRFMSPSRGGFMLNVKMPDPI